MAWTAIPDKSTGDQMDETWYDTYFKANMEYLLDPNKDTTIHNEGSDYTTTSTSFVDIDATDLAITLTTNGGPVLVMAAGGCTGSTTLTIHFDFTVDGTRYTSGNTNGIAPVTTGSGRLDLLSFAVLVTGLSAGSHSFKLQWRVNGGTGTLHSQTSDSPVYFAAIEI